jgi:hypothetical protein
VDTAKQILIREFEESVGNRKLEATSINTSHPPKKKDIWKRLSVRCLRTSKANTKNPRTIF